MRKECLDCVYKHLAAAAIAETEFVLGYPKYKLYVVGNLDHAAQEAYRAHRTLARVIREHRLRWWDDPYNYDVPYEELGDIVEAMASVECPETVELPEECYAGLEIERTGTGAITLSALSMDTRP